MQNITGKIAFGGIAIGKIKEISKENNVVRRVKIEDAKAEIARFEAARDQAAEELKGLYDKAVKEVGEANAAIFEVHQMMLEDEDYLDSVRNIIEAQSVNAEFAVATTGDNFARMFADMDDDYMKERAADVKDISERVIRVLSQKEEKVNTSGAEKEKYIIAADDLAPSETIQLDRETVLAFVTRHGSTNSHTAILARSYGIPAILGVPNVTEKIPTDTMLAMDGLTGEIFVTPGEECICDIREKQTSFFRKKEAEKNFLNKPAIMKDGTEIKIGINIGSQEFDVPTDRYDFIGLFRTEFLYMEGKELPGEETQFEAYRQVVQKAKGHPITLRTLDIGGDKTLPYMELPKEDNPFLGKRAIRLCFAEKELFLTQLRAALRASAYGPLQIMFPMVGSLEDIRKAKEYLNLAKEQLKERKQQFDEQIRIGIMIEIPAIALIADLAAEEVDFASIGSNDLTQYLSAADRMNPEVAAYYKSDSTAMLRLLRFVFQEFSKRGKEISVCGEMAGNPETARLLVGLGARKLSMSSGNIAGVKAKLAECTLQELTALAEKKL